MLRRMPPVRTITLGLTLVVSYLSLSAQVREPRVNWPAELSGEARSYPQTSEPFKEFVLLLQGGWDTQEQLSAKRTSLSAFLDRHPDIPDAYLMRAMIGRCLEKSPDISTAVADIEKGIAQRKVSTAIDHLASLNEMYGLLARLHFEQGDTKAALDELETAIELAPAEATGLFNTHGVDFETTTEPCGWTKADYNRLVVENPQDYRPVLYRGLAYSFFSTFKREYEATAIADQKRATVLNPTSALAFFELGRTLERQDGLLSRLSDPAIAANRQQAIAAYTRAISLRPRFALALAARASLYYESKQHALAVRDFDAALETEPHRGDWLNDRGLAHMELRQFSMAISDFTGAIREKGTFGDSTNISFENRANAHLKVGDFERAADDLTQVIKWQMSHVTFLMKLSLLKLLYPELRDVADDVITRQVYELFFSDSDYPSFAAHAIEHERTDTWNPAYELSDLYTRRGNANLAARHYRAALADYRRVADVFPTFAPSAGRWRLISSGKDSDIYIDGWTAEVSSDQPSFWIKTIDTSARNKGRSSVINHVINCSNRTIAVRSSTDYDPDGNAIRSFGSESSPSLIIPGSVGEQLYRGICR